MLTVLVVDDDPTTLDFVTTSLAGVGLRVETTQNASAALALLARQPFDAVLLEVLLPEKEGVETIMEIRRRWPRRPVMAMSGGGDFVSAAEALALALAVGAGAALLKPFSAIELLRALEGVLAESPA